MAAEPELTCDSCEWCGNYDALCQDDDGNEICPECLGKAGDYIRSFKAADMPRLRAPNILDQAIAGSIALDPAGSRKPAAQLRVPSLDEQEAERIRVARVIAGMGRPS